MFEMISSYLPLLIHLREKFIHVHQIFILQREAQEMTSLHQSDTTRRSVYIYKRVSHVFGFGFADLASVLNVLGLLHSAVVELSEHKCEDGQMLGHGFMWTRHQCVPARLSPLFLCQDEFGEVSMQLVFLADPLLFYAVPAFLLGNAKSTWDIVSKIQPLFLRQVIG